MLELRDKVAVVTGSSAGIGAALAVALHAEGCRVALVDIAPRLPDELASSTDTSVHSSITVHEVDVADGAAWDALAAEVEARHGSASILVNNAGLTVVGAFADHTHDDIERIVDVNVKGVMHGCRAFLPQLLSSGAKRGAHIVNVSSLAGRVAFPYQTAYSATKFAVRGFTAALRIELAARGVGVTAVLPGAVATNLLGAARSYDAAGSSKLAALMLAHGVRPRRLAARVLRAIRQDEPEVSIGLDAYVATTAHAVAPAILRGALSLAFRLRSGF
jgi:short-subunit dehydrogenase